MARVVARLVLKGQASLLVHGCAWACHLDGNCAVEMRAWAHSVERACYLGLMKKRKIELDSKEKKMD